MRLALAQVLEDWRILHFGRGGRVACDLYSVRFSTPHPSDATITEGYDGDPYSMTR